MPYERLIKRIRLSNVLNTHMTDEQEFQQMHLAAVFVAKVYDACRAAGVTPKTATGRNTVDIKALLEEAEQAVGMYVPDTSIGMMNRWKRYEVEWEIVRRRKFCYSFLLRVTSGGIVI